MAASPGGARGRPGLGLRCRSPMPAILNLRSLEAPIVQAGMGGVARHELAAAVSEAGGLGTIAGVRAPIAAEIAEARGLTARPIAVNLLLPFV
jgi:nitronate monooxygenase